MSKFFRSVINVFRSKMNNTERSGDNLENLPRNELIRRVRQLENKCNILQKKGSIKSTSYLAKMQNTTIKKQKKHLNFSNTRLVALKVSYLGWNLEGFQDNAALDDTIERLMLESLIRSKLVPPDSTYTDLKYSKCGRTDKEVSAYEQVMCYSVRSTLNKNHLGTKSNENNSEEETGGNNETCHTSETDPSNKIDYDLYELDYPKMLNSFLPHDIRVLAWSPIPENFNARYDCSRREYRYMFPIGKMNIAKIKEAAGYMVGPHDFRNFCKLNVAERTNHVRVMHQCDIERFDPHEIETENTMYQCIIVSNGFLYHQIRYTMTILFLVGLEKEEPNIVSRLLDINEFSSRPQYAFAEAYPLSLYSVTLPYLKWRVSPYCRDNILWTLQTSLCKLKIQTAMTGSLMKKFEKESLEELHGQSLQDRSKRYTSNSFDSLLHEKWSPNEYKKLEDRGRCLSITEAIDSLEKRVKRINNIPETVESNDNEQLNAKRSKKDVF